MAVYREVRMPTLAECKAGKIKPYIWRDDHDALDQRNATPDSVINNPMPNSVREIRARLAETKVAIPSGVAMPEMEWGFSTGRRIDAHRFVRDAHEGIEDSLCFGRLIDKRPEGWQGGARVIVQCSVMAAHGQKEVFNRSLAAMAVANELQAKGVPTEVLFCWASSPSDGPNGIVLSMAVENPSIETIARLSHPAFFRTWGFAARSDARVGTRGYGDGGGGRTIMDFFAFKSVLFEAGMLKRGDILIDWSKDFDSQVKSGVEQYQP